MYQTFTGFVPVSCKNFPRWHLKKPRVPFINRSNCVKTDDKLHEAGVTLLYFWMCPMTLWSHLEHEEEEQTEKESHRVSVTTLCWLRLKTPTVYFHHYPPPNGLCYVAQRSPIVAGNIPQPENGWNMWTSNGLSEKLETKAAMWALLVRLLKEIRSCH